MADTEQQCDDGGEVEQLSGLEAGIIPAPVILSILCRARNELGEAPPTITPDGSRERAGS